MTNVTRRHGLQLGLAALAGAPVLLASAGRAQAATHNVTIQGFAFSPASLDVAVGDTVIFTNKDSAPHTATANDGSFDTGTIKKGKSAEVTVNNAGSTSYKCNFHSSMKGLIRAS